MRFAVALCFLVAFCTIDANSASIQDDLEIWRLQVRNAKWTVDGIIRQLQDLRSQAEEDALLKVTEQWDGELESYRSFKNTLLNGIKTGNALSSELDSIFLTCHDSDIIKMQNCIITELTRVNADIKTLQSDANSAEITVVHATDPISKDLEIIKLKVKNAIGNVESIIQQLEHVRIDTEEDTRMTVTNRWWDQMDTYQDFVNLLTASMRREVNAAKAKGKDAQHCYDTNYCGIMQHRDTANKAAIKCQESAENSIKNSLGFIDNLVS
ncbi:glucosamine--fructose-6-phosphate aminotransferase, partial [Lasius niger]